MHMFQQTLECMRYLPDVCYGQLRQINYTVSKVYHMEIVELTILMS